MSSIHDRTEITIQAKAFDFAIAELVLAHRDRFQPLWTVDSWVKFLIWMALNCGLSGEKESIELFVDALGSRLSTRMRKIFFERNVEELGLQLIADPAELNVLVMPLSGSLSVNIDQAEQVLDHVGLLERIELDKRFWQTLDGVIAIPWKPLDNNH